MSEHLLFLQAAGSDFNSAHDLVAAVVEAIRTPHGGQDSRDLAALRNYSGSTNGLGIGRSALNPRLLAERLETAGCERDESLIVALSVLATTASPLCNIDTDWITSVANRIGETALLEAAGVVFAFNTINRIADARRVRLEYGFLRELRPIRGWLERRLASVTGLAYDLSYKQQLRQSPDELQDRLNAICERLELPAVPEIFNWLSRSPVILEGVLEMIDVNLTNSRVRSDLYREAVAIGLASKVRPGSDLSRALEQWLPQQELTNPKSLREWAVTSSATGESDLVSACRRYAWQVANAAYTITDEQIRQLTALGLSNAELLDLTLATSAFSALAIIEPISAAVTPAPLAAGSTMPSTRTQEVHVQLA